MAPSLTPLAGEPLALLWAAGRGPASTSAAAAGRPTGASASEETEQTLAVAALVVATAVAAALTACGGGTSTEAVHGQVLGGTQSAATVVGAMGGGTGICGGAVSGTQVIIKGTSGKLLATTNLRKDTAATRKLSLPATLTGQGQVGVYDFSATIPAGNGPYTIDLVGVNSTVVSAKQLSHLQPTCG